MNLKFEIIKVFKVVILFSLMSYTEIIFSQDDQKSEKSYSEAEFQEAVKKEVQLQLAKVRPQNMAQFSAELLEKAEELKLQNKKLENRERQLKLNEDSLTKKIAEFEKRQQQILGCISQNEKEQKDRVEHLVQIISSMRPNKAAEVLSVQEPDVSVKILSQIESKKASKIFNLMEKEISARLQRQYMDMKK